MLDGDKENAEGLDDGDRDEVVDGVRMGDETTAGKDGRGNRALSCASSRDSGTPNNMEGAVDSAGWPSSSSACDPRREANALGGGGPSPLRGRLKANQKIVSHN